MNIDFLIEDIRKSVSAHKLPSYGAYARYLWQNEKKTRKMGSNEYGCADAANILYSIGDFPRDKDERDACVNELQAFQNPETGLFFEGTHHAIHCTAHCTAALELFDEKPLYRFSALERYRCSEGLYGLLNGLDWDKNAWSQAHQGAGIYAAMVLAGDVDISWQRMYFEWLYENADPQYGISRVGAVQTGLLCPAHHLFGWFHYLFNFSYARRPFPYPERVADTCITLYDTNALGKNFGKTVGFPEIDWVYALNRAATQTGYRFSESKARLYDFAGRYIRNLSAVNKENDEMWNDLHMLFGGVCTLAELQQALPGELETSVPLKLVLDRRPFI